MEVEVEAVQIALKQVLELVEQVEVVTVQCRIQQGKLEPLTQVVVVVVVDEITELLRVVLVALAAQE